MPEASSKSTVLISVRMSMRRGGEPDLINDPGYGVGRFRHTRSLQRRTESDQGSDDASGVLSVGTHKNIDVASCARYAMEGHRVGSDNDELDTLCLEHL